MKGWEVPRLADPSLTVLLGPGLAPALAGLGVLCSLRERNVPVGLVVGVNTGALAAALWAAGPDLEFAARVLARLPWHRFAVARDLASADPLLTALNVLTRGASFSDLRRPIAVVAVEDGSGKAVWMDQGSVARAVRASVAVPGLFGPLEQDGRRLVDGGAAWPLDRGRFEGKRLLVVEFRAADRAAARPAPGFSVAALELARETAGAWGRFQGGAGQLLVVDEPVGGLLDFHRAEEWFAAGRRAFEAWLRPGGEEAGA